MIDLIRIIKILGVGYNEIVIDVDLTDFTINSIELDENDNIVVHVFDGPLDLYINYDDLNIDDKEKIKSTLSTLIYN